MKCPQCKEEVLKITTVYIEGVKREGCSRCITLTPICDFRMYDCTGKKPFGVAHKRDIKQRKYDYHTDKVYRDVGRRYFTMSHS